MENEPSTRACSLLFQIKRALHEAEERRVWRGHSWTFVNNLAVALGLENLLVVFNQYFHLYRSSTSNEIVVLMYVSSCYLYVSVITCCIVIIAIANSEANCSHLCHKSTGVYCYSSIQMCYLETQTAPQPPSELHQLPSQIPPCFPWQQRQMFPGLSYVSPCSTEGPPSETILLCWQNLMNHKLRRLFLNNNIYEVHITMRYCYLATNVEMFLPFLPTENV